EGDLGVLAARGPADADVARGTREGARGLELAGIDPAAVVGAAGVVVERRGCAEGQVDRLGAAAPAEGAGGGQGAARQGLVDLERGFGGELHRPLLVDGCVRKSGEGAYRVEVRGELK